MWLPLTFFRRHDESFGLVSDARQRCDHSDVDRSLRVGAQPWCGDFWFVAVRLPVDDPEEEGRT